MTHTNENKQLSIFNDYTPVIPDSGELQKTFARISDFQGKLYSEPNKLFQEKTPDGKAETLVISHIETRLDEVYSGLWNVTNFRWQQIANEIVGCLTLEVFHPVCGVWIKREGSAAIQVMMDKAPDNLAYKDKNLWALDMQNKKPNALYTGFPKLKAECLKNAAKSLGMTFGRDLNRKKSDKDFEPEATKDLNAEIKLEISQLLPTSTIPDAQKATIAKMITSKEIAYHRLVGMLDTIKSNQK